MEKTEKKNKKKQEKVKQDIQDSNENINSNQSELENQNTEKLKDIEEKIKLEKDKYLRLYAEFENFRRRSARERIELISTATEDILRDILPIIDDLERASEANVKNDDIDSVKQGFELICEKFKNILFQKGLKEMDVKEENFDSEKHEAITKIKIKDKKKKGKIVDILEKGYYVNSKILRYAKVVVGE